MILDEIAARTRKRILERKVYMPLPFLADRLEKAAERQADAENKISEEKARAGFEQSLRLPGLSFICEVKKASPSKGLIAEDFPYLEIAKDYEAAGAAAISCLTEPYYFQGKDEYLEAIAQQVSIPVLRKDFTVDPYMIYEAKLMGASAVLLICAILKDEELEEYRKLAESLGLSALVEAHDEEEVRRALASGARIIGVNNRDLRTFEVDIRNSIRLRSLVPDTCVFVSESGIRTEEDMKALYENGTDAVLIGETLMRAPDKKAMIARLRGDPAGQANRNIF